MTHNFIDTHTHLATDTFDNIRDEILKRSLEAGVSQWISIGTNLEDCKAGILLSEKIPNMHCTVGIHPHHASEQPDDYIAQLEKMVSQNNVCGIGEIGLDYHYDFADRNDQKRVFAEQLELATSLNLPIVIHSRDAMSDTIDILDAWGGPQRVVFHCYSGDLAEAKALATRGYWLSYTGTITFKNAEIAREVAREMPLDHIMLETDCPYMSPAPMRKKKPNEPALLIHIAEKLAEIHNISLEELSKITVKNSRYFFGI